MDRAVLLWTTCGDTKNSVRVGDLEIVDGSKPCGFVDSDAA